ncbi:hypothetical protein GIX45_05215 [Erwinia sp. CPCC 100877]|nr:hypothetical protein [Erwinia sp. CPCC 100877]
MSYWFRQFVSKRNLMIYSSTWLLTIFIGGLYNFYSKNHTKEFSLNLMFLSLYFFFSIFIVVETERIYQTFKLTRLRLLPVSLGRIYFYNLLFSLFSGLFFVAGQLAVGFIVYYVYPNIHFVIPLSGLEALMLLLDLGNLFLIIQLLFYCSIILMKFVQKKYRSLVSSVLFIAMAMVLDYFLSLTSTTEHSFLAMYAEQLSEASLRMWLQMFGDLVCFWLTCWLVSRYIEAEV